MNIFIQKLQKQLCYYILYIATTAPKGVSGLKGIVTYKSSWFKWVKIHIKSNMHNVL